MIPAGAGAVREDEPVRRFDRGELAAWAVEVAVLSERRNGWRSARRALNERVALLEGLQQGLERDIERKLCVGDGEYDLALAGNA